MGQFSWLDCIDETQILDDVYADVYLLIPKEFGGGHIHETYYDGYGNFGGKDVYDLVAEWNKDMIPYIIYLAKKGKWGHGLSERDITAMQYFFDGEPIPADLAFREQRCIGISMACYDDDNARLEYPIKITHDPNAVYENCEPSLNDPNQGWKCDDDNDCEGW